jgi:hypothetical protein
MAFVEQRKITKIDRGLYLVRYAAADDQVRPPLVKVSVEPCLKEGICLVLHPDHSDAILWQPGSCLVVSAENPSQLIVEVTPSDRNGSSAATVKIEALTQGEVESELPAEMPAMTAFAGDGIRVLGHVAGIGDVFAKADEWLAGPTAPSRIEGIAIEWPRKPEDLDIRYSVRTAKREARSEAMRALGAYAGTRGRALPVVGVALELSGRAAPRYQIAAEALYLGSTCLRVTGKRIDLAGPTGREPLVGFRLSVEPLTTKVQAAPLPKKPAGSSGRVRVFRSRGQSVESLTT